MRRRGSFRTPERTAQFNRRHLITVGLGTMPEWSAIDEREEPRVMDKCMGRLLVFSVNTRNGNFKAPRRNNRQ
jgi:hypothetical protein